MQTASSYQIGLVSTEFDEHASYAGWLCFPYITKLGGVVSLKFRHAHDCREGCGKKYLTPYPTRIYNALAFDQADRQGWICVTEGEIDAITLEALCGLPGEIPAVGIPGVDTWAHHPEWKELFRGYRKVYVFEDQDEPNAKGERPGEMLCKQILKQLDTAELVKLPGKDVNSTYVTYGPKVIKERIGL